MASIVLTWVDNSNDETGFHIYRGIDGAVPSLLTDMATDAVTFTDPDLAAGSYQYEVSAFNANGESERIASNVVVVEALPVPIAPSNVVATLTP